MESNLTQTEYLEKLRNMRDALLDLHKELLEYQKRIYEATESKIANPAQYYDLVVNNASFAWLRTLSALVISIDEVLESKEPAKPEAIRGIFSYTKKLLTATGHGDGFESQYVEAIRQDGQVSVSHGKIMQLLG